MWPEDVKCPIVVGLAGLDRIVPSRPLRRYLLSHGDFVTNPATSIPSGMNTKSTDGLMSGGGGKNNSTVGRSSGGGARSGLGRPGGAFALMNGNNRCKVHTCKIGGKCTGHGAGHVSAPCHSGGGGISSAGSNGSSVRADGKGGVRRPTSKGGGTGSGSNIDRSGGGVAKRVELVYWSDSGHGNVLGDPWALDEFVQVATRQEQAFLAN